MTSAVTRQVATTRGWAWGQLALALSVLAWMALLGAGVAFAASFGSPGDGSGGIQAMQGWILAALGLLVASAAGSLVAAVLGWRRQRGAACALIAVGLLTLLLTLVALLAMALRGPAVAAAAGPIWQAATVQR